MIRNGGRPPRRLLHTSDLHLSSLGDSACHSLEAVVNASREARVDVMIVAGDLFDHHRVEDNLVSFVAEQLRCVPAPVVILPGNHDCLIPGSALERPWLWKDCSNIHVLKAPEGEMLTLPDLGLALWGKSILSYEQDVRPLAGIPQPQDNGQWYIALAHGYYVTTEPPFFHSYNITHEEIIASGWDYIALGHLVTFRCVCSEPVTAYYCGSPSSGTAALVDLSEEKGVQVSQHILSNR